MGGTVLRVVTRLNRGGPLRQLEALVPALAERGWTGPVLAGRAEPHEPDGTAALTARGVEVIRLPSLRRGIDAGADARALREVLGAVRRIRPTLVHTHLGKAGAVGRLAARMAGVPAVHTFHGHHFDRPGARGLAARAAERSLAATTTVAIALSPRQRDDLVDRHGILPAEKVVVIGPGIDIGALRAESSPEARGSAAARLAEGGLPVLLWAGRFVAVKEPLLAVEATARATRPFRLVMAGEGPLRSAVRAEVRRRGLESRVVLPGPVEPISPWIAASAAVALSSSSEGTPIVILEAKALGRPAVATAVGGVPDLVEDGVDGLLVPPGDATALAIAMDRITSDRDLAARLGSTAARRVEERYGAERLGAETAALYERVAGAGRR
jgi:glycosyltransferase involved in cell wall biosynthesis